MTVIAIDAVGITEMGGGRSATLNVLRELLRLDVEHSYVLLLDQPEPELASPRAQQVYVPVHGRIAARVWGQLTWPMLLRRYGVQLVHHIKNLTTIGLPGRSVVTVYDLTIVLHSEFYPRSDVFYWRYVQPHMLRRADRIVAISETTAQDLVQRYGLRAETVQVIYPAYDPRFAPATGQEIARVRQRYGTGDRFVVHVGSLSQKKNLLTLLLAYEQLCQRGYPGKLVLVGRSYGKGYDTAFYERLAVSPVFKDVVVTGPVPAADLPALYSAAELMAFPTLHEGFGIAPLEAMACGTPVVTTRVGALPEVLGGAALMIDDPYDANALAAAAERLINDAVARSRSIAAGLERARRYSAAQAAVQHLALYTELL